MTIFIRMNGAMWIIDNRTKTGTQFRVKLLPVTKSLVEKYSRLRLPDNKVFPVKYFASMDMSLHHVARHAEFVIQSHDARWAPHFRTHSYSISGRAAGDGSKMLGCKHITTTQIYATITNDKIGRDMDMLTEKIADKFRMA